MVTLMQEYREIAEQHGIDVEFLQEKIEEESMVDPEDDEGDEVYLDPLDAQAAQANRETRTWECCFCEGAHYSYACHLFDNISMDQVRMMPNEDAKEFLTEKGLGKNVPYYLLSCTCRICESDHPTRACSYRLSIPRGVKVNVSSQTDIICSCCSRVGAHTEDMETLEFFAALRICEYCYAVGRHKAQSPEDCPNKEAMERVKKFRLESLKMAAEAWTSTRWELLD